MVLSGQLKLTLLINRNNELLFQISVGLYKISVDMSGLKGSVKLRQTGALKLVATKSTKGFIRRNETILD